MRTLDLSPLFRHSVGFDHLDRMLGAAARQGSQEASYPPYNIARHGEHNYRITLAVAGFGLDDLEIITKENVLSVRGQASEREAEVEYLHRGIARRPFEHRFQLADHVVVLAKGRVVLSGTREEMGDITETLLPAVHGEV